MAVTLSERRGSRTILDGPNPRCELLYKAEVDGETDPDLAVRNAALAELPAEYDGKPLRTLEVSEIDNLDATRSLWAIQAVYAYASGGGTLPTGGSTSSFDTTGGTRRVTQSLSTIGRFAPDGQDAPDFQGAINVNEQGVEGVDVPDPKWAFREIRIKAATDVTTAFRNTIYSVTARVNSEDWQGYPAGTVLFRGATGNQRSPGGDWEIVYHFEAIPNTTGLSVGEIEDVEKDGWDYLWVLYGDVVDDAAQALTKRPTAVYVERVLERANFSDLGL